MTGEIILLLILVLSFAMLFMYLIRPQEHPYEVLGRADPIELFTLVHHRLSDNPIEDHFIRGQAFEHVLDEPALAMNEYIALLTFMENDFAEEPTIIHIDTVINRIEDFNGDIANFGIIRDNINYYDIFNPTIFSDPQNVHDTTVNNELKDKYNRLRGLNGNITVTLEDIFDSLQFHPSTDIITKVIDEMRTSYSYISKLNDNEINVLLHVYQRCNTTDMKSAFYDALVDSFDTNAGRPVCPQGRVARILETLTLLDDDTMLREPIKTDDIVRKEFMSRAHKILEDSINSLSTEELVQYDNNDVSIDDKLRDTLDTELRNEYSDSITPIVLDKLIKQAQMGI